MYHEECFKQKSTDIGAPSVSKARKSAYQTVEHVQQNTRPYYIALQVRTVKSRKFEVLGTRDFISKNRKIELSGGRYKNI